MSTIVTKTVKPNGGGDYASLQEAVLALQLTNFGAGNGVLTGAADTILRIECYAGVDTLKATLSTFTTDATHYVEIYAAAGQGHAGKWDTTKYRIEITGDRGLLIGSATTKYVRVKQLQILVSGSVTNLDCYFVASGITGDCDIRFVNCLARVAWSGQGNGTGFHSFSGADVAGTKNFYHVNCIAFNVFAPDSEASEAVAYNSFSNASCHEFYFGCAAISCDRGFRRRTSTIIKNSYTIGCREGFIITDANFHANSTNIASSLDVDAVIGTGSNPQYQKRAAFFVDPINYDFRLHQHDVLSTRPLAGLGADLSADSDYPTDGSAAWPATYNYGIDDTTRVAPWAIGPSQATYGLSEGVWWLHCGGVTNKTAKILMRQASESHAVTLKYGTDPTFTTFKTASPVTLLNGRRLFTLTGLTPDTTYFYMPVVAGGDNTAHSARFKTMPTPGTPTSFRIGYFADQQTGAAAHCSRDMDSSDALYLIQGGDLHYENITSSSEQPFFDAYDTYHSCPWNMEIFHHRPVAYVWDDHDFGPPNSDSTSPSRDAAELSYRDSTAHHALPAGETVAGPIYHSFVIARCRVIMLDLRSQRSPNSDPDTGAKTMLGSAQKAWLKAELLSAKNAQQIVLLISSVPWNATSFDDTWYGFSNERREIADFMQLNSITAVIKVSADHHFVAIDDGTNDKYTTDLVGNGQVQFVAAPFEQFTSLVADGTYSLGIQAFTGSYGLITISDSGGSEIVASLSGRRGPVELMSLVKAYTLSGASGASAPLGSYSKLQETIIKWLNREGEADIEAQVASFIQMLEDDLNSDQEWNLERYSHRNGELFTVDIAPLVLPVYVRELRAMWQENGTPIRVVNDQVWREHVSGGILPTGDPQIARVTPLMQTYLATEGARVDFWPQPTLPISVDMFYLRDIEPLATAVSGTPLSLKHPNIYIYGALLHATPFLEHDERLPMFQQFYDRALRRIKIEAERAQFATAMRKPRLPVVFS